MNERNQQKYNPPHKQNNDYKRQQSDKRYNPNLIRIGQNHEANKLLALCLSKFLNEKVSDLKLSATGRAITKACLIAENLKRRITNLHQVNEIFSKKVYNDNARQNERKMRNLTFMEITLTQSEPQRKNYGYQRPLPQSEVKQMTQKQIEILGQKYSNIQHRSSQDYSDNRQQQDQQQYQRPPQNQNRNNNQEENRANQDKKGLGFRRRGAYGGRSRGNQDQQQPKFQSKGFGQKIRKGEGYQKQGYEYRETQAQHEDSDDEDQYKSNFTYIEAPSRRDSRKTGQQNQNNRQDRKRSSEKYKNNDKQDNVRMGGRKQSYEIKNQNQNRKKRDNSASRRNDKNQQGQEPRRKQSVDLDDRNQTYKRGNRREQKYTRDDQFEKKDKPTYIEKFVAKYRENSADPEQNRREKVEKDVQSFQTHKRGQRKNSGQDKDVNITYIEKQTKYVPKEKAKEEETKKEE